MGWLCFWSFPTTRRFDRVICDFCLQPIAPEADRVERKPSETKLNRFSYFHLVPCWEILEESNRKSAKALNAQKGPRGGKRFQ